MSVNPDKFTRERGDILRRDYPAGVAGIVILERLNALPGAAIDSGDAKWFVECLKLSRPPGFVAQKANAEARAARVVETQAALPAPATPPSVDITKASFKDELNLEMHYTAANTLEPRLDWNARAVEILEALWTAGFSMEQIGQRMGVSKNSICGKVHRLNLPSRPSPIRRDGVRTPRRARPRAVGAAKTLPALQAVFEGPSSITAIDREPAAVRQPVHAARSPIEPAAPKVVQLRPREGVVMPCQWPFGDPRDKSFRFCLADSEVGRPYCGQHCSIAYVVPKAHYHRAGDESVAA